MQYSALDKLCKDTGRTVEIKTYIVDDHEVYNCVFTHKILIADGNEVLSERSISEITKRM